MRLTNTAAAIALAIVATPLGALAQANPTLDATARAMGGKDRILAVRTLVIEGTGESLNFGQNQSPYAENKFEITALKQSIDFANRRWLIDQTRVPRFTTGNMNPQRARQGLDGAPDGIAYNVNAQGNMQRAGAQVAVERMNEFLHHPIGFVMAAYRPQAQVSVEGVGSSTPRIVLNAHGNRYTMVVDRSTRLPLRIERTTYQAMLGDAPLVIELGDWGDANGITVPRRITQRLMDRWTLNDYRLSRVAIDEDVGNLAATDSVRAVTLQSAPPPPTIVIDTLAPGVWSIAGQSHHTIAIEQSRRIVLVEAPQSDARSLAAIAAARRLRPDKPVDLLINTHHHFDHSGGVRAAISEGLPIMTHLGNRDFYEKFVAVGNHTIQRDALSQNPKAARIISVSDKQVLADSVRSIEVYPIEGNAHSATMLVVYLPAERILIQADLYNPPAANAQNPVFPFAANLVENIQRRGLQVDRVVGIHGRPVPFSEVQAAPAPPRAP